MEIPKIVLDYIKILIWPIVIIYLLRSYREPLSDFFRRIVKGQAYGFSLEASNPAEQRKEIKEGQNPQSQEDIKKYITENPDAVIEEYLRVYSNYWFERAYRLIYGTQIELLEHLEKLPEGDTYTRLSSLFYKKFLNQTTKLFSTQFVDYIGFLQDMNFVEFAGEGSNLSVKITQFGVDFLSYIMSQYPTSYKYKAF